MGRVAGCCAEYHTVNKWDFKNWPDWFGMDIFDYRQVKKALKRRKTLLCLAVEGDSYGSCRGCMAVIFV